MNDEPKKSPVKRSAVSFALVAMAGVVCIASAQTPQQQSIVRAGSQPSAEGPEQYFTGKVRVDPVFPANADMNYSASYMTFAPGARSAWRTHPAGQRSMLMALSMASLADGPHLNVRNRIRDVLEHPAFGGHGRLLLPWDDRLFDGRLLLPWDDRRYDVDMQLTDIASLLPYHSHVNPTVVVGALNRMIDDVNSGKTVFFDFYTEAEKRSDPTKRHTGLFFYRGKQGAPFALIAPGGGIAYVGSVHEGFPYASEISKTGYNAFVLKYRAGQGAAAATQDMAAALSYVSRNANALGVAIENYSVWGSSAGARMAAAIGSHGTAGFGASALPRPATVVMAYTKHSEVASDEPPTFVVVGEDDAIAPPSVMARRVDRLRSQGSAVEFHRYPNLGHGFGLGTGTSADGWVRAAILFWERSMSRGRT